MLFAAHIIDIVIINTVINIIPPLVVRIVFLLASDREGLGEEEGRGNVNEEEKADKEEGEKREEGEEGEDEVRRRDAVGGDRNMNTCIYLHNYTYTHTCIYIYLNAYIHT